MRDASELTEREAELVNRLIKLYPAAGFYVPDRDPPVYEIAKELIEEGRVERKVDDPEGGTMISYRLTNDYAEEIRRSAAAQAERARWN